MEMTRSMELPPDASSDEITIQIFECENCSFSGVSVYEESRRGALDSNSWRRSGYRLSERAMAEIVQLMVLCPQPENRHCACDSHRRLSQTDANGHWHVETNLGEIAAFWELADPE